jgi:hypothetical protein
LAASQHVVQVDLAALESVGLGTRPLLGELERSTQSDRYGAIAFGLDAFTVAAPD